jgi:hypothetical protein
MVVRVAVTSFEEYLRRCQFNPIARKNKKCQMNLRSFKIIRCILVKFVLFLNNLSLIKINIFNPRKDL